MHTNGIGLNGSHGKMGLEAHYHQAYNAQDYIRRYFNYLSYIMEHLDTAVIEQMIETFITAAHSGKTIYLLGNGGSAATASHMAADFLFGTWLPDQPPFRVISLNDNIPVMTAIANDTDYSCLFCNQLRSLVQPGDVVLALSVSGNSPNVLEAVQLARERGAITLGCCGFDGGTLRELVDICLHIPSNRGEYGPVEDIMMVLDHVMHSYIMLSRQGTLQRSQAKESAL